MWQALPPNPNPKPKKQSKGFPNARDLGPLFEGAVSLADLGSAVVIIRTLPPCSLHPPTSLSEGGKKPQIYKAKKHRRKGGALFIALGVIGKAKQIIYGYAVKLRKPDEHIGGDIPLPQLVVAVYLLRAIQKLS